MSATMTVGRSTRVGFGSKTSPVTRTHCRLNLCFKDASFPRIKRTLPQQIGGYLIATARAASMSISSVTQDHPETDGNWLTFRLLPHLGKVAEAERTWCGM